MPRIIIATIVIAIIVAAITSIASYIIAMMITFASSIVAAWRFDILACAPDRKWEKGADKTSATASRLP